MPYIEDNLLPEETVLLATKPHYLIFWRFFVWLGVMIFIYLFLERVDLVLESILLFVAGLILIDLAID